MKIRAAIVICFLILIGGVLAYLLMPGPRAWPRGAWDAADHNQDGVLTREEMVKFGKQAPHRNAPRLLWHFDSADTNSDQVVDAEEVAVYGTNIGSKDPNDHLLPPE